MNLGLWMLQSVALALFMPMMGDLATGQQKDEGIPKPPNGKTWELIWSDEFNGSNLDLGKWEIRTGSRKGGYWSEDNISIKDGKLVIETKFDGSRYTTAGVWTRNKFEHKYGLWVIKVKLPRQEGHWAGFWLFSDSVHTVGNEGRDGTEIDIVEELGKDKIQHVLHWDGYGANHKFVAKKITLSNPDEYHIFSLWWTATAYCFYVDGVETWRTNRGGVSQVPEFIQITDEVAPFDQITDEVESFAGNIRKAMLPDYYYVDYVRVYDLKFSE